MSDGIYSALSGAIAQQRQLDVVANNVANANTSGFRQDRVAFSSFVATNQSEAGIPNSLRFAGVTDVVTTKQPGAMRKTGNPMDLALQGNGMFAVETSNGVAYTRDGSFQIGPEGTLLTSQGYRVLGTGNIQQGGSEILVPPNTANLEIMKDGTVRSGDQLFGKIAIVVPEKQGELEKIGDTLFHGNAVREADITDNVSVIQGSLERSNVNAIQGVNELISLTRAFDALQRIIQTYKDLDKRAATEITARG